MLLDAGCGCRESDVLGWGHRAALGRKPTSLLCQRLLLPSDLPPACPSCTTAATCGCADGDLNQDGVYDHTDVLLEQQRAAASRRLRVGGAEVDEATLRAILRAWVAAEEEGEGDIESPTKRGASGSAKRGLLLSVASFRSLPSRKPLRPAPPVEGASWGPPKACHARTTPGNPKPGAGQAMLI